MQRRPVLIAVVDDDEGIRVSVQYLLRAAGFRTLAFACAEDLLAYGERSTIDCFVIDVNLPGMNGVALARLLRSSDTVAVVLISARDDPGTLALIRQSGALPFLRKPFGDEELLSAIARAVDP